MRLEALSESELRSTVCGESSASVRRRVEACREHQRSRNGDVTNAEVDLRMLEHIAPLGAEASEYLGRAMRALGLTARSWHRVIRVARTIADLAGAAEVCREHLSEALTYRILDEGPV